MSLEEEYRDFRCYEITDNSETAELDIDLDKISELFSSEGVYLFVRYDIRRIFIWKGPRSPVRKRFISSRIASKFQEKSSQVGMHLKIVSVDAGDEPVEFLNAFKVSSYEVSAEERPQDMYYIRNEERRKMEEEKLHAKVAGKKSEKEEEYWSPVLEEQQRLEQMEKAKKKAVSTAQEIASSIAKPSKKEQKAHTKPPKKPAAPTTPSRSYRKNPSNYMDPKPTSRKISYGEEKAVLDLILSQELPEGKKRLNIIIGTALYGPKRMISSLFGKEVEEVHWDKVTSIPDGMIKIETNKIRVYCKDNEIEGIEIMGENSTPKDKPKRNLKEIPSGK